MQTISWTLSDGLADHIDIYLSRDAGASWEPTPIASFDYLSIDHFDWTVTGPEPLTYSKIKVVATNADGTGEDESGLFIIESVQSEPAIIYGTTVITHGYLLDVINSNGLEDRAGWTIFMAKAIVDRLGLGEVYTIVDGSITELPYTVGTNHQNGEKVVVFDWMEESDRPVFGLAEAAADVLFANLIKGAQDNTWSLEQLHFIGHSRGAVVNSEVIQRLGYYNNQGELPVPVDINIHMTTLDPHPADDEDADCVGDPIDASDNDVNLGIAEFNTEDVIGRGVVCWKNVRYADNYRQGTCVWFDGIDMILNGLVEFPSMAYMLDLTNVLDGSTFSGALLTQQHSAVHAWYYGTINTDCTDCMDTDGINTYYCGDGNGLDFDPCSWYSNLEIIRDKFGFGISRNFVNSAVGAFWVDDGSTLLPDDNMNIQKIFNGDFSMTKGANSKLPGWTYQGGGGAGHINSGYLELDQSNGNREHNTLYVPNSATQLSFIYRVTNIDDVDAGATDSLDVFCSNASLTRKIGSIKLSEYVDHWKPVSFDILEFSGTTIFLHFQIGDYNGDGIDSEIRIDNVHFDIDNHCSVTQIFVAWPVDIEVISPTGEFLSRDSAGIRFATYDRYELTPGDTGATITIPNSIEESIKSA